ncbi:MAG: hypothetical protein ACR2H3_08825 [Acidimicrobiales bacterium]
MAQIADVWGATVTLKDFFERYGPTIAVVALVGLVLALLPGNVPEGSVRTSAGDQAGVVGTGVAGGDGAVTLDGLGDGSSGSVGVTGGSGTGSVGRTGGTGTGAGGTGGTGGTNGTTPGPSGGGSGIQVGTGPYCRSDGRTLGISKYTPPCLVFNGSNGGATARGVTGNKIQIYRFVSQIDPATQAILEANKLADDPAVVTRAYQALVKYSNQHFLTYGREVIYSEYQASDVDEKDEAMRADAKALADEKKAFAVIGGPKVLGTELAARGVICICTVSLSSEFYLENPPYIFGSLPTSTEYSIQSAEYIGKRLKGKLAKWAGQPPPGAIDYRGRERKFGLIYLEGSKGRVDPEGKRTRDAFAKEFAKYGMSFAAEAAYLYDPGRNQQDMTNMIAQMVSKGVTTVVLVVDPLTPAIITAEASRQQYYPEWFITGTGLSDTSAAGRIYDKQQWAHAFGISPLWVTWKEVKQSEGYREFHHGMPGRAAGDEGVLVNIYRAPVQQLFIGVQMAGPRLTADTFAQGQFNYPPTGGTAAAPLAFQTRQYPTQVKDFVEVWYAVDEPGKDERGEEGFGMMMKVDGGRRYQIGQWPGGDPKVFVREGAIAVSDNPAGGGPLPHEQDGHKHTSRCTTCA